MGNNHDLSSFVLSGGDEGSGETKNSLRCLGNDGQNIREISSKFAFSSFRVGRLRT